MADEKEPKIKYSIKIPVVSVFVIIVIIILIFKWNAMLADNEQNTTKTITTTASLEKILEISDLSTYDEAFNGVAHVYDKEDPETLLYHVAYEAEVKVGIDMNQIKITTDDQTKKVTATLPETKINDVIVDMASLDYMFKDSDANTENVSKEAYAAAIADAKEKSASDKKIKDLARENSENVVKALIEPLLEKEGYTLEIK